ncbi:hypothetical protein GCM10025870_10780 [Agromyces marinus]|uniref:Uncharacterized protein n=1 Tax=Agromyces marinus TaxID=1389020 RepID=A0ABN6YDI5_9MICO|nr:hypothetical protein GCM10025870_10780 [Agromyces marinus]
MTTRWLPYRASIEFEPTSKLRVDEPTVSVVASSAPSTVSVVTLSSALTGAAASVTVPSRWAPFAGARVGAPTSTGAGFTAAAPPSGTAAAGITGAIASPAPMIPVIAAAITPVDTPLARLRVVRMPWHPP